MYVIRCTCEMLPGLFLFFWNCTYSGSVYQSKTAVEYLQNEIVNNLKPIFPHLSESVIRDNVIDQSKLLIDPLDQTRLTNNCIDVLLESNTGWIERREVTGDVIDLTDIEGLWLIK